MSVTKRTRKPARGGFTLLELIVVITIIGLLGTLVVTKVAPILFRANKTKIEYDLKAIVDAAKTYYATTSSWPESIEEMANSKDDNGIDQSVLEEVPKDPWGGEYGFEIQEGEPVAWCLGKDQSEGGDGDDQDYRYPPLRDESY